MSSDSVLPVEHRLELATELPVPSFGRRPSRRAVLGGLVAVALTTSKKSVQAGWFGDVLIGVGGAAGIAATGGFLAVAGAALLGWKTIKLMGDADDLVGDVKLVGRHIDQVLTEVSATLKSIDKFVKDCDTALLAIEDALKKLPGEISAAFNAAEASKELGYLRGQSANLSAYLISRSSIHANAGRIQTLCEQMVESISAYGNLEPNSFQFTMQTVPAITTWVQGYLAYNLIRKPGERDQNPWDHTIVSSTAIPRFQDVISKLSDAKPFFDQLSAQTASKIGVLYQDTSYVPVVPFKFNEPSSIHVLKETDIPFKWVYSRGEIDDGFYYAICPGPRHFSIDDLSKMYGAPYFRSPPLGVDAEMVRNNDNPYPILSYLVQDKDNIGFRFWSDRPTGQTSHGALGEWFLNDPKAADARAYITLMNSISQNIEPYQQMLAFHQIADGMDGFQQTVKEQLIVGHRHEWQKMPRLTI
jgi:hypothetical protein